MCENHKTKGVLYWIYTELYIHHLAFGYNLKFDLFHTLYPQECYFQKYQGATKD